MHTAIDIIHLLELEPHPEGGHFRETFRDNTPESERSASTAIYYLLGEGEVSRWHRVDASEAWHWYAGAALELRIALPDAPLHRCARSGYSGGPATADHCPEGSLAVSPLSRGMDACGVHGSAGV